MLVASEAAVKQQGLKPMAKILGMATAGAEPRIMGIADDLAKPPESLKALAQFSGSPDPVILEGIGHVPSVE